MEIICYPTYGYKKDGAWRIPMRVWMHTTRSLLGHPITSLMIDHSANFEGRIADLIADNERILRSLDWPRLFQAALRSPPTRPAMISQRIAA